MNITLSIEVRVGGVLTAPDATPKLQDPTSAFGVRLVGAGTVIVASGTLMTGAAGTYSYLVTGVTPGATYEWWAYFTIGGVPYQVQRFITAPTAGGMTLTEARARVRYFGRNTGGDSSRYDDSAIDYAIQFLGSYFVRKTRCLPLVSAVTVPASSNSVDLSALAAQGFRPERLLSAYLASQACPLDVVEYESINRKLGTSESNGLPRMLAWEDWSTAAIWPAPPNDSTLKIRWNQPFSTWTAGTATPDDVTLNLPSDWLTELLPFAPAVLQYNEPEQLYASAGWKHLEDWVRDMSSVGSLGVKVQARDRIRW